ncbi:DUF2510 domain-containing protein [Streptomyces sp. NPDC051561]|uniref:DUF2510 domain-containing protein n=1 Tax=Streptomyces sp. NPDC051561 TaxID=3365658 RepID=UPI0037AE98F9
MSMTTPPGWYQDPSAPTQERWWDGAAWSAQTRAPGAQQPPPPQQFGPARPTQPQGYGYPQGAPGQPQGYGYPQGAPPAPPGAPGSGGGGLGGSKLIVLIAAGVVVVAAIVLGVIFLGKDDSPPPAPAPTVAGPAPGQSTPAEPSAPGPSAPSAAPSVLSDQLNGITLPLLEGWELPDFGGDRDAATMTTKDTYDCPAGGGFCRHGTVTSRTAPAGQTTAEAAAKADIKTATDLSYGKDYLDREQFGGVKSHQEVKSEPVTVAGKQGYLVRWKVVTGKGPGGYVQSLAFPSSIGPGSLVLVRFAFDAGPEGPPPAGMDQITQGIRNAN